MKLHIRSEEEYPVTHIETEEEFEKRYGHLDFVERDYEEFPDHIAERLIVLRDTIANAKKEMKNEFRRYYVGKMNIKDEFTKRVCMAANCSIEEAFIVCKELLKIADESKKLAVDACNRELTRREKYRDEDLDRIVAGYGRRLGLKTYRQDDPRGWTIRVEVGPEFADCMDGISTGCG